VGLLQAQIGWLSAVAECDIGYVCNDTLKVQRAHRVDGCWLLRTVITYQYCLKKWGAVINDRRLSLLLTDQKRNKKKLSFIFESIPRKLDSNN